MSDLVFVNQSKFSMPRTFVKKWLGEVHSELPAQDRKKVARKTLTIVFLDTLQARKLNHQFRGRNYATDILSFPGEDGILGELVICPQVIERQAKEHELSFEAELGYMLLHGVLHLLGYDHEDSKKEADRMFRLQDTIFEKLAEKF